MQLSFVGAGRYQALASADALRRPGVENLWRSALTDQRECPLREDGHLWLPEGISDLCPEPSLDWFDLLGHQCVLLSSSEQLRARLDHRFHNRVGHRSLGHHLFPQYGHSRCWLCKVQRPSPPKAFPFGLWQLLSFLWQSGAGRKVWVGWKGLAGVLLGQPCSIPGGRLLPSSQLVHLVPHGPAHCPQSKAASGSTGANRRAARSDTNRAPETREESCQGTATATDAPRLATSESGGHHGSSDRVGIKRLRAGKTTNVDWALFGTGLGNRLADTVLLVTGTALYSNWSLVTD